MIPGFVRNLLDNLRRASKTRQRPARRQAVRLVLESLEERLTPVAGAREQYMLELINRMRANPAAELSIILGANNPDINNALNYFHVNQSVLAQQWASLTGAPPLAWNDSLAAAAYGHSQNMLSAQSQAHQLPGEPDPWTRITNAGYSQNYSSLAENIYAFAHSIFEAHAAFAIDWGATSTGIQDPPGHRQNIMDTALREIGIGLVDAPGGSSMGPLLVTQDFGNRFDLGNSFLVGSVYDDTNGDGFYSQGEGMANVSLSIAGTPGTFHTTTTAAGGYQIQLPAGTYQMTVSGGTLASPLTRSVTIGSANVLATFVRPPIEAPSVTGPATGGTDTTPTFTWTDSVDATRYALWVNNVTTGQQQIINVSNLTTTNYTATTPLPAGNYQVWVQASNDQGQTSAWSATYAFAISAPAIPTLTAPTGSSTNSLPAFAWTASTDATRYDLWVDNVTTGQSQVIRQQTLTTNAYTATTALPPGNYAAWVQAFNNAGSTAGFSARLNFAITLPPPPAVPSMTGPTGSTTNTAPALTWSTSTGASRYDLWLTNTTTGVVTRQQTLTAPTFTPTTPLGAGNYTAWVQAFNSAGATGGWSAGMSFTIAAPTAPPLTGPGAVTTNPTPTFTWNASTDAVRYELWVSGATGGAIIDQYVTTTSYTATTPLAVGTYRAWTRAANNAGDFGPWSAVYNFQIDTTAPAIPTLTGPATGPNLTPTITWTASAGATRYDLWVNNLTTGQPQVIRQQNLTTNSFPATLTVGAYRAWVQAFDGAGQTRGWSAGFDFTVTKPAVPVLTGPAGNTTNTTPAFTWSNVAAAVRYDLWVDNRTTGQSQVIRQQNLTANTHTPTTALPKGTYRFWVQAFNANGDSSGWSAAMDFTIV